MGKGAQSPLYVRHYCSFRLQTFGLPPIFASRLVDRTPPVWVLGSVSYACFTSCPGGRLSERASCMTLDRRGSRSLMQRLSTSAHHRKEHAGGVGSLPTPLGSGRHIRPRNRTSDCARRNSENSCSRPHHRNPSPVRSMSLIQPYICQPASIVPTFGRPVHIVPYFCWPRNFCQPASIVPYFQRPQKRTPHAMPPRNQEANRDTHHSESR